MKRRNFLRSAGIIAASIPFANSGFAANALNKNSFFARLGNNARTSDKIMVFIQLEGGNDGLNTLIPLDQYQNLNLHRPDLIIPESSVLGLTGHTNKGLHPAMEGLQDMYNDGLLSIVQNVGYPNQDYSHFRSMDIWMTGANTNQHLDTGWLGRMIEADHPNYPTGYPNLDNPDPLAIQIGSVVPVALMGSSFPMGIAVNNPDEIYELINDYIEPAPATPYGDELTYIRTVMQKTKAYYDVIKAAAVVGQNFTNLYPPDYDNYLADQLKIVARLINGGLTTPVYVVSLGGFDTHSEQITDGDPTGGNHANLLRQVSEAIYAFQDDLRLMGKDDKVCGMTFSEFGRTIADNDSLGTDHGAAAPLFVFGKNVNPGIIGTNPIIEQDINESADVPMQHDFRAVYASVLQDWFGFAMPEDVLFNDYPILPIFKDSISAKETPGHNAFNLGNYPNPVLSSTTITFMSPGAFIGIDLLDIQGRLVRKIVEANFPTGLQKVRFEREGLPSGTYFYRLRMNGVGVTRKMLVL